MRTLRLASIITFVTLTNSVSVVFGASIDINTNGLFGYKGFSSPTGLQPYGYLGFPDQYGVWRDQYGALRDLQMLPDNLSLAVTPGRPFLVAVNGYLNAAVNPDYGDAFYPQFAPANLPFGTPFGSSLVFGSGLAGQFGSTPASTFLASSANTLAASNTLLTSQGTLIGSPAGLGTSGSGIPNINPTATTNTTNTTSGIASAPRGFGRLPVLSSHSSSIGSANTVGLATPGSGIPSIAPNTLPLAAGVTSNPSIVSLTGTGIRTAPSSGTNQSTAPTGLTATGTATVSDNSVTVPSTTTNESPANTNSQLALIPNSSTQGSSIGSNNSSSLAGPGAGIPSTFSGTQQTTQLNPGLTTTATNFGAIGHSTIPNTISNAKAATNSRSSFNGAIVPVGSGIVGTMSSTPTAVTATMPNGMAAGNSIRAKSLRAAYVAANQTRGLPATKINTRESIVSKYSQRRNHNRSLTTTNATDLLLAALGTVNGTVVYPHGETVLFGTNATLRLGSNNVATLSYADGRVFRVQTNGNAIRSIAEKNELRM